MTGVQWLVDQVEQYILTHKNLPENVLHKFKKQALEIEKQNIIDSYNIGYNDAECNHINDGEQYYSQTFNHD